MVISNVPEYILQELNLIADVFTSCKEVNIDAKYDKTITFYSVGDDWGETYVKEEEVFNIEKIEKVIVSSIIDYGTVYDLKQLGITVVVIHSVVDEIEKTEKEKEEDRLEKEKDPNLYIGSSNFVERHIVIEY